MRGRTFYVLVQWCYCLEKSKDSLEKALQNENNDKESNSNYDINDNSPSSISDEYLKLLKLNEPEGFRSTNTLSTPDNDKKKYNLVFKASNLWSNTRQDTFDDLFVKSQINNTTNDDIRVDGKIYFEIIKTILEDLLEKDESLDLFIGFIKINNCKKNNETLENMFGDVIDLPNYIKILINFVYYALYASNLSIVGFYNQIDINKDCGAMEAKDVIEIFFRTFLNTALGNQITLGFFLEDSNKINNNGKLYKNSDKLKDYANHKIEVNSHFFGGSYATSEVYLLEYIYVALYFSLNNILHFYNSLPKLVHE